MGSIPTIAVWILIINKSRLMMNCQFSYEVTLLLKKAKRKTLYECLHDSVFTKENMEMINVQIRILDAEIQVLENL